MNNNSKVDFLSGIEGNQTSVAEFIKKHKLWSGDCYNDITRINSRSTNTPIHPQDIFRIYKSIYDSWYDYIKGLNFTNMDSNRKMKIQYFLTLEKYKKERMTPEDCYRFVHFDYDQVLKGTGVRPAHAQNGMDGILDGKGNVYSDFVHCMPFDRPTDVSCRLYLNMKPENIATLTEMLLKKAYAKRTRVYFKFWTNDNRNDTFLIYTNYDQVQRIIGILKEIQKENPKIFYGCENINPMLTNLEGFIGYGEEPEYKHSSFNRERADAIDEFSRDLIIEERKRIGNDQNWIRTSTGEKLYLEDYLVYRLEQSFKETIIQHQKDILNRRYPRFYAKHGDGSIRAYIDIENKIYNKCMNELPPFVKEQIREQAKRYLEGLKRGEKVYIQSIKFPTQNRDLFPTSNEENLKYHMQKHGYLTYDFRIDIKLEEKLFSVFRSYDRFEMATTDEALAPYLEKHHVSSKNPSLNLETEHLIETHREIS